MKSDPAIDSIRRTRHQISEQFGHDTKALVEHYKSMQKQYAGRLVVDESSIANSSRSAISYKPNQT